MRKQQRLRIVGSAKDAVYPAQEGHVLDDLGAPEVPTGDEVCQVCGLKRSACRQRLNFTPRGWAG